MSLEIGQVIEGKYRIVKLIGEGGMGAVYEGENVRIRRRVAIKVLHSAFTGNTEVMQRFEREAQAAGHIGNDHILEVLDLGGLPNGDFYMVMEFLDGEPLSKRIETRGQLTPHELAPLAKQMLKGLSAAHTAGIVHRDLKPDNIFILREKAGKSDFVKIIDFGISKFQPLSGDGMKMTRTGAVMGTPYYMSPEQASGSHEADARSDVYALGVILYEAVTGRVPFDASTFNQLLFKIVLSEVPPPQTIVPDLDPAFISIITKAMARDPAHRFQTCDEFIAAIDGWVEQGKSVSVPPPADAKKLLPTAVGLEPTVSLDKSAAGGTMGRVTTGAAGNWSTSPELTPDLVKKKTSPIAIGAIAALVVVGLGGAAVFGAFTAFGSDSAEALGEASAAAVPAAAPAPEPTATSAELEKPAEPSVAPAAPAASAEPAKPPVEPKKEAASAPAPAPAPKPVAKAPASRPKAPSTTTTPTAKSTTPKPATKTPDFGY